VHLHGCHVAGEDGHEHALIRLHRSCAERLAAEPPREVPLHGEWETRQAGGCTYTHPRRVCTVYTPLAERSLPDIDGVAWRGVAIQGAQGGGGAG
jgi:hypothetical protein